MVGAEMLTHEVQLCLKVVPWMDSWTIRWVIYGIYGSVLLNRSVWIFMYVNTCHARTIWWRGRWSTFRRMSRTTKCSLRTTSVTKLGSSRTTTTRRGLTSSTPTIAECWSRWVLCVCDCIWAFCETLVIFFFVFDLMPLGNIQSRCGNCIIVVFCVFSYAMVYIFAGYSMLHCTVLFLSLKRKMKIVFFFSKT